MSTRIRPSLLTGLVLLVLIGCRDESFTPESAADQPEVVLARVNGAPITKDDVHYWLRGAHGQEITEEMEARTLERLVEAELVYQEGLALGLDRDAQYRKQVGRLELSLRATQRTEMMKRVYNREVAAHVAIDDEETRAYYDSNQERIARELHLGMIQLPNRAAADQALEQLRQGRSFEDVAEAATGRGVNRAASGWDLGLLSWSKIPVEWHETVYALEKGEVSDVFVGPQTGIVIFKLLERSGAPPPPLETVRSVITSRFGEGVDPSAYYERHADRIGLVLQLGMIPFRDEASARAARERIERGVSFEELADSHPLGHSEPSPSSWDLGFLNWSKIPLEWHDVVYGLEPGEVSGVFEGTQTGTRLFKLYHTRPAAHADFTSVRNAVMNRLKEAKVHRAYEGYLAELRQKARIERIRPR